MEDFSIVTDEYYYIKEKAFKAIHQSTAPSITRKVKEHGEHTPEQKKEKPSKEVNKDELRRHKSRKLTCPVDNTPLLTLPLETIFIDYCPKCFGIWLDAGELDSLLRKDLSENSTFRDKLLRPSGGDTDKVLACPVCNASMNKKKHIMSHVTSDICLVCGGIWLDSGEFAELYLEKRHEESAEALLYRAVGNYIDVNA
ncbi:MAG: zf-TFIIB domain-containing protein [Spirochaetales bacterium]|nr:zf-TFIIB domain-containing protein [Spirochaetales bacterium]